jgi:hypothetical protein
MKPWSISWDQSCYRFTTMFTPLLNQFLYSVYTVTKQNKFPMQSWRPSTWSLKFLTILKVHYHIYRILGIAPWQWCPPDASVAAVQRYVLPARHGAVPVDDAVAAAHHSPLATAGTGLLAALTSLPNALPVPTPEPVPSPLYHTVCQGQLLAVPLQSCFPSL